MSGEGTIGNNSNNFCMTQSVYITCWSVNFTAMDVVSEYNSSAVVLELNCVRKCLKLWCDT